MFAHIFCYFCLISTLPYLLHTRSVDDDDETIDLTHLGSKLFGSPKFNATNELTGDHPEEEGPYVEGDLLVPTVGNQRNGMKSESLRWQNGEIPFVIRGRFSKLILFYRDHVSDD